MWFFLVQTLGALAAAMGLGLLAGWLLFGGPGGAHRSKNPLEASDPTSTARLTTGDVSGIAPVSDNEDIRSVAQLSQLGSADERVSLIGGGPGETFAPASRSDRTSTTEADSLSSAPTIGTTSTTTDAPTIGTTSATTDVPTIGTTSATMHATTDATTHASEGAVSEPSGSVEYAPFEPFGPDAMTGSSGGPERTIDDFGSGAVSPRWEVEELESELEARTADVARLKLKLRKAVEEIEKRTAHAAAAREARDEERRRSIELAEQLAMATAQLTLANSHEARSLLDKKNLEGLEADLELAKHRAGELTIEVEELTRSHAELQSSSEAERQALSIEAASLRLRTEGALDQLNEFSREIAGFHAEHAQHLARSQQLTVELQAKLSAARAALSGRALTHAASPQGATLVLPSGPVAVRDDTADLTQLPGLSKEIANQLSELGVSSVGEIAAWSAHDVRRMQEWLPEYPNIVTENRWVDHARGLVRSQRDSTARNLSGV